MSYELAEPTTDPRYPLGRFDFDTIVDPADRPRLIEEIASLPALLRAAVQGATEQDLARTYREGGWTVRQLVHHVPDSHMNGFVRLKLALTEDRPVIKPYDEVRWAELPDVAGTPIEVSLALLEAVHHRWVVVLRAMKPDDFARVYVHPEHGREISLDVSLANYAWHGKHHLSHVRLALRR